MSGDDSIRQRAEELIGVNEPVAIMYRGDIVVGRLDALSQYGLWIQPVGFIYLTYQDIDSIRLADLEEI